MIEHLMNLLVRRYLKKWDNEINQIKENCAETQENELTKIRKNPQFQFFHGDISHEQFKAQPTSIYQDYESRIADLQRSDIAPTYWAQSSGTSGKKKLIPVAEDFITKNHLRGSWYQLHTLYEHNPKMSVFKAKNLLIGGSLYQDGSRQILGDISGIMISRIPLYMRPWYVPKIQEAIQADWSQKINITAQRASQTAHMSLIAGTPTWVLTVLRKTLALSQKEKISDLWPELQAYIHGGVNFQAYRQQFEQLIDIPSFRYIEVYNATEGFFAYQDRPHESGMLLMCASGIYYEFIRSDDYYHGNYQLINVSLVEIGVPYVMVITTSSGLMRYIQGDIITFVSIAPYRIQVIGRIGEYINAFGEDLLLSDAQEALVYACALHQCAIDQFTVAPSYISIQQPGYHEWYIEFNIAPSDIDAFADTLDHKLRMLNHNYDQKRTHDIAMICLKVIVMPRGTTINYLSRHGQINGQAKMPRMRNDRTIAIELLSILNQ